MLPIRDPTDIRNPESVQALLVRRRANALYGFLRRNPLARTRGSLVVVLISGGLRDRGKVLVNPALQM